MHKTKKKTKTAKLPKPIKVKKEKSDEERLPQPMTHYMDDRLEMIKQIFNTLKPKTIINLAPDFLKAQALEEIEEACLNELLCISTKRLKSIITATKCPTDTESSDNDSDVERHEEHISLEEISSDSEIDGSSKKAKKKKATKTVEETDSAKKNTPNEDNQEDGQISVLELLELQARARAIRSQLALEPVTKIEVDSDEENQKKKNDKLQKKDDKLSKNERKRLSSEMESRDSAKFSRLNDSAENLNTKIGEKDADKTTTKKFKLKRNYRNATKKESEDEVKEGQTTERENNRDKSNKSIIKDKPKEHEKMKNQEILMVNVKKEKRSRSPSPDVIPIVAEPETLLINDSSDEEHTKRNKKVSSSEPLTNNDAEHEILNQQQEPKNIEKEPGELNEETENASQQNSNTMENEACDENKVVGENLAENNHDSLSKISGRDDTQDSKVKSPLLKNPLKEKSKANEISKKSNDIINSNNHSDDDQNDDVISLGGDLENEMNEELEKYNKKPTEESPQDNSKSQDESQTEDVISLESSEDDGRTDDNQSWHSRYMKSSKVSKVLAASRLGNRVRDKIKKSKHSKNDTLQENLDVEKEKSVPVFTSKHEDGSVEQYKELLEMRQRKP